ncbi:MAG: phosphotransferase, partial [Solirubrobacterales bacterium]|nr:phosphotransferase [Solirubrobacterales bacterium]
APEHAEVCERLVEVLDAWESDRRPPMGLVHGDYRLDNMLFHGEEVTVVDWQTLSIGPAMRDAAYFLTGGLKVEDRREHEESLVRAYHDELLAQGVKNFDWETCWEEYRRQPFLGLIMAIAPAMIVQRTDRGDDMFMAVVERTAQAILDLGSLELLPAPGTSSALRPDPADEGTHETGPEDLWNESWYFDAIADDGSLGVYYRLGRLPNWDDEGACMLAVCIVRPGEPAIMLVEETPLPEGAGPDQEVRGESGHSEQICEEPLQRFRVRVEGTAGAHADHSAPLRGEAGEPVEIAFDLVWETDGIPYQWRLSTRYEIPCRVSGTVTVGGESFELNGPGQRDHSWGGRDWWASDWMWSALHLADGTHTHAVTVPTHPDFGVGYVQRGEDLRELGAVTSSAVESADGLTESAAIGMPPGELDVELEPLAFGAMLLEAPDGRVSHFPRAMCRVRTAEGVEGLGWVEWNRNQR